MDPIMSPIFYNVFHTELFDFKLLCKKSIHNHFLGNILCNVALCTKITIWVTGLNNFVRQKYVTLVILYKNKIFLEQNINIL